LLGREAVVVVAEALLVAVQRVELFQHDLILVRS
jgi:hypothetical protein